MRTALDILVYTCTYMYIDGCTWTYWYIQVCHILSWYIIGNHGMTSVAGFRGARRDFAVRDIVKPPAVASLEQDEGDPAPCPEDEEFFGGPDAESQEEAINQFLDGLEGQERTGFKDIHRFLDRLPVPAGKDTRSMTHTEARASQFLPDLDEDEQKRFTPSELLLYRHALEYR